MHYLERLPDETLYVGPDARDARYHYHFDSAADAERFKDALRESGRWAWMAGRDQRTAPAEVIERP